MAAKVLDKHSAVDIPSLIRGNYVTLVGRPASMNGQEFVELIQANGGKHTYQFAAGVRLVVVGQRDWPLTPDGVLSKSLREVHKNIRRRHLGTRVTSEEHFLSALGLEEYRQNIQRLY